MLLLFAIVQSEDAPRLVARLVAHGLRLTRINSAGELLDVGNTTLLLGIEEEEYDDVLEVIHATCRPRTRTITAIPALDPVLVYLAPLAAEVGGAVVFGVPVACYARVQGGIKSEVIDLSLTADGARDAIRNGDAPKGGRPRMKLIVAIVQSEEVNNVSSALVAAGHRLTRINPTAGFLHRGNSTLLIGVAPQQVDEVVQLIDNSCRPRYAPAAIEKGLPAYAATLFVLDAPYAIRI